MNNLFEFDEDYNIVMSPQAMGINVFRNVRDKYKEIALGIQEMNYIIYLLHPKSDFSDLRNEEERSDAIIESIHRGKELRLDKITEEAIDFYKERYYNSKINFLNSALDTLNKTKEYLDDIDFTEKDDKGGLVYDPKKVVDLIAQSPKLMAAIKELEDQIRKEEEIENSVRGSGKKGVYED